LIFVSFKITLDNPLEKVTMNRNNSLLAGIWTRQMDQSFLYPVSMMARHEHSDQAIYIDLQV